MSIETEDLRQVMRNWASGVTVVTAANGEVRHGMTVSSFTSISIEPPRILISLEKTSRTHDLVLQTGHFGITILSQEQLDISDRFAGRMSEMDENRFKGLAVETLSSGVPFIVGGLAYMDCKTVQTFDSGTNTLFIGEVVAMCMDAPDKPLLYFDREYHTLGGW